MENALSFFFAIFHQFSSIFIPSISLHLTHQQINKLKISNRDLPTFPNGNIHNQWVWSKQSLSTEYQSDFRFEFEYMLAIQYEIFEMIIAI